MNDEQLTIRDVSKASLRSGRPICMAALLTAASALACSSNEGLYGPGPGRTSMGATGVGTAGSSAGPPPGGAGTMGAGTMPTYVPIPTDAPTVPGEGQACRFSIECGQYQLCVDDTCVRHERVDKSKVNLGELRSLRGDALRKSPLYTEAPISWDDYRAPTSSGGEIMLKTWVFPGAAGPQLVFTFGYKTNESSPKPHYSDCQIAVVGDSVRVHHLPEYLCHVAGVNEAGEVAVVGEKYTDGRAPADEVPLTVRKLGLDGQVRAETDLRPTMDPFLRDHFDVQQMWPDTYPKDYIGSVRHGSSVVFDGEDILLSLVLGARSPGATSRSSTRAVGHTWGHFTYYTALLRVTPAGDVAVEPVGGIATAQPYYPSWFMRDSEGLKVLVREPKGQSRYPRHEFSLLSLGSGQKDLVHGNTRFARYVQSAPEQWSLVVHDEDRCRYVLVDSSGARSDGPPDFCIQLSPNFHVGQRNSMFPMFTSGSDGVLVQIGSSMRLWSRDGTLLREFMLTRFGFDKALVRRFGLSFEGVTGTYGKGTHLDWFELALTTR